MTEATEAPDKTSSTSWPLWAGAVLFVVVLAFLMSPLPGHLDDKSSDALLVDAAEHIRPQMSGAPADQISRAAVPTGRATVLIGWSVHDDTRWAMCVTTGSNRHLVFGATGDYEPADGMCPDERFYVDGPES